MIHSPPFDLSARRVCSPLTRIDPNAGQRTHGQHILKSPPSEQHRLKRLFTHSGNTSVHQFVNMSYKENLEPQSQPRFMFSTRSNQVQQKTAEVRFTNVATSQRRREAMGEHNFIVNPFTLVVQESKEIEQRRELREDDFIKLKELGKGKFGTVWLVVHKKLGFLCALKIISKAVVREEKVEYQVAKEIRIHNALNHQNIIGFYGYFADKDHFFIVSQYATEGHLFGKIRKRHRLEEEEVKDYTRQTADGLMAMHRRGFIHRDIKPQNLLLQFGVVKLCDFGWAAECQENTLRKSQCGTPLYYSPQIVKKEPHNSKIDVWSLGLLAYQLIVGRVPFSIWSEFDLHIILERQVSLPNYIDASDMLSDFILACLVKNQNQRKSLFQLRRHPFLQFETNESFVPGLCESLLNLL